MMDYIVGDTIYLMFTTRQFSDGVPTALAGSPIVSAYENDNVTQITAGITLGVSHDSVVGMNLLTIVATGVSGYEAGKDYNMVITTGTVGGVSVVGEVVGTFSLSRAPAALGLKEVGAGTSPTANGLTLKSGSIAEPGDVVHIRTSGNSVQGTRIINAFDGGTEVATFSAAWDTTPTTAITYALFASPLSEAVTVESIDTDVMDNVAMAASMVTEILDALLIKVIEGTVTFQESMTLQNAAAAGKLSGGATATNILRDLADTLDRITATVDSVGNRSAITTVFTDLQCGKPFTSGRDTFRRDFGVRWG